MSLKSVAKKAVKAAAEVGEAAIHSTLGNPDLERLEKMTIIVVQRKLKLENAVAAAAKGMAEKMADAATGGDAGKIADSAVTGAAALKAAAKDPFATVQTTSYEKAALLHVQFNPEKLTMKKQQAAAESKSGEVFDLANSTDRIMNELGFKLYYNTNDAGPESIGALTDVYPMEGAQGISVSNKLVASYVSERTATALFWKIMRAPMLLGSAALPDVAMHKINPLVMKVSAWADFWELMGDYDPTSHEPWMMQVSWGDFKFYGRVKQVDIEFTRFSQSGVATEMTVDVKLLGERHNPNSKDAPWFSPDTDKIKQVQLDTNLSSVAQEAYEDASQWRRIAQSNDIDNPRRLMLGANLRVPAI